MTRQRVLGIPAVLAGVTAGLLAVAASGQAASAHCPGRGHVLARGHGVIVFSRHRPDKDGNAGPVYACRTHGGLPVRVYAQSSTPRVVKLTGAGRYVGFFLWTNEEVYSKFLVVFDKRHARIELRDLAECDGNDECTGPDMTGFRLASNGWAAELWPQVGVNGSATGLLATDGGPHYQLDLGEVSQVKLSAAGQLSWADGPFDSDSVALGSDVVTPASPQSLTACDLLAPSELIPVLGPDSSQSSSSAGECTYQESDPSRTLTVNVTTGLSPSQVRSREDALGGTSGDYCNIGNWWPADDNFYDLAGCDTTGGHYQYAAFSNGVELLLDLTGGTVTGGNGEVDLDHLSNVALDKLFAVPISRS